MVVELPGLCCTAIQPYSRWFTVLRVGRGGMKSAWGDGGSVGAQSAVDNGSAIKATKLVNVEVLNTVIAAKILKEGIRENVTPRLVKKRNEDVTTDKRIHLTIQKESK